MVTDLQNLPSPSRAAIEAELQWRAQHKLESFYPGTGPLRRELYVKHMEFFEAGATKNERLFMAANRVGKSEGVGAYEMTLHLTGNYPAWWKGRRFKRPVAAWAAGKDAKTTRDIIQLAMLGSFARFGTGLIPADAIIGTTPKVGIPEAAEIIRVRHASGGASELQLKSYDSGIESFFGTKKDVIWLDEECEQKIYVECLTRTLATVPGDPNGIILFTFTPLWGVTDIVQEFMRARADDPKHLVTATWDDAPHLSAEAKAELYKSIPPHLRDARTKGIPQLGSGAIYPISETEFIVDDFAIPDYWPRGYGMDVGWSKTAAIWGAHDRDNDIAYLTSEHYRGQAEPVIHAEGIKARGNWIPGFIDPAANGRSQIDGRQLLQIYRGLGLTLQMAENAREAGIYEVWMRLSLGKLKVFRSCGNWLDEKRIFARDENGKIVNEQKFHLMAATRYLFMGGMISRWIIKPPEHPPEKLDMAALRWAGDRAAKWME
jgi:phage terminase large subunit-like protein